MELGCVERQPVPRLNQGHELFAAVVDVRRQHVPEVTQRRPRRKVLRAHGHNVHVPSPRLVLRLFLQALRPIREQGGPLRLRLRQVQRREHGHGLPAHGQGAREVLPRRVQQGLFEAEARAPERHLHLHGGVEDSLPEAPVPVAAADAHAAARKEHAVDAGQDVVDLVVGGVEADRHHARAMRLHPLHVPRHEEAALDVRGVVQGEGLCGHRDHGPEKGVRRRGESGKERQGKRPPRKMDGARHSANKHHRTMWLLQHGSSRLFLANLAQMRLEPK
mmetsp:Transcript_116794/g.326721  ORF Transcript_116794/g.326721 Transcript_116794/m.326721 type:complete len:276 (-) Transcript_116794:7-834(-)